MFRPKPRGLQHKWWPVRANLAGITRGSSDKEGGYIFERCVHHTDSSVK